MKKIVLFFLSFCFAIFSFSQEICDNAIDDDGDGLIDLNDDECDCAILIESSLIPNPSFESTACCPDGGGELSCAETWIQASEPTTDYYNIACGYPGFAPTPLPGGGDGYVGFISNTDSWSEHVGACLPDNLIAGAEYTLNLYIASSSVNTLQLSLYGTPNCGDLPWAGLNCPIGIGDWFLLADVALDFGVSGTGWQEVTMTFVPAVDVSAVAIGGTCYVPPLDGFGGYFFLDELSLVSSLDIITIDRVEGICGEDYFLLAENESFAGEWQWYKDNIALLGETDALIDTFQMEIQVNPDHIIYAPNTFTPDGDNYNQTWNIIIDGIDVYDFHLVIFNRWGELIWESYDPAVGWHGNYGGSGIVQDGTYVWQITAKDSFSDKQYRFEGMVNVLR